MFCGHVIRFEPSTEELVYLLLLHAADGQLKKKLFRPLASAPLISLDWNFKFNRLTV